MKLNKNQFAITSPHNIEPNSIVILKVGQYLDEIKKQLINISSNIEFYE